MLKILWKRGEIAPGVQFLLLPTIFSYLMLDFYVKTMIRFSLRDMRLFTVVLSLEPTRHVKFPSFLVRLTILHAVSVFFFFRNFPICIT